jgi:uncharacterized LabA/DUF88 family protein
MQKEPQEKRAIAFVDGQNLYYAAKAAFGYTYPNYDAKALAEMVCRTKGWQLTQTRFYTGVPSQTDNAFWNEFWERKLAAMGRMGIHIFSRQLRYRNRTINVHGGDSTLTITVGEEKGIDVRIALDMVGLALSADYDVAVVLSQDQDLSEAVDEIRSIAQSQNRWIKVASAFPLSPMTLNKRGINETDWLPFAKEQYDTCLDPTDYTELMSRKRP